MFRLEFSEKVNTDIISALKYISEVLEVPRTAEEQYSIKLSEVQNGTNKGSFGKFLNK